MWGMTQLVLYVCAKSLQLCPTLCDPMDHSLPSSSSPGKDTGMSCHALLQESFPTQGSNPCLLCLLHWQVVIHHQHHLGSPQLKLEMGKKELRLSEWTGANWLQEWGPGGWVGNVNADRVLQPITNRMVGGDAKESPTSNSTLFTV